MISKMSRRRERQLAIDKRIKQGPIKTPKRLEKGRERGGIKHDP